MDRKIVVVDMGPLYEAHRRRCEEEDRRKGLAREAEMLGGPEMHANVMRADGAIDAFLRSFEGQAGPAPGVRGAVQGAAGGAAGGVGGSPLCMMSTETFDPFTMSTW